MSSRARWGFAGILILALLATCGCIRSRVRITSDPPGAAVKFQGVDRGETPVTIPFIWYWYYDIDVAKEGYQTAHAVERFKTPPWFYFPLDFFAELIPIPIPDTKTRHYALKPLPPQP
jgi:hypothetical protein